MIKYLNEMLEKNDTFEFGKWNNKPIEWLVLSIRSEHSCLCISKYLLEKRRYDEESSDWDKSELRRWLNTDFYNKAFSPEEKSFIESYYGDKVNLLSKEGAKRYLPSNVKRRAYMRNSGDGRSWWLRSDYQDNTFAEVVDFIGTINRIGQHVKDDSIAVRPVILLNRSVDKFLEHEG